MGIIVTLTWYERLIATLIGLLREASSQMRGSNRAELCSGKPSDENHIDSAGAEQAVGKFLWRYWLMGVNTFKDPDVAPDIEVRRNTYPPGESMLKVKPDDPDDRIYVLVRGVMPTYEIVGWLRGYEAKLQKWLRHFNNDAPVFYVPESELHYNFQIVRKQIAIGEQQDAKT